MLNLKISNFKFQISAVKQSGFTLIEILIVISILGLLAVVSIPNLKRFNEEVSLGNARGEIVKLLRQTQLNSQSGIKCSESNSTPTSGWEVTVDTSSVSISPICVTAPTPSAQVTSFTSPLSISSTSCTAVTGSAKVTLEFKTNVIKFYCYTGITKTENITLNPLVISVVNSNLGATPKNIEVNKGGSIYAKD